jgi:hypothetical protein
VKIDGACLCGHLRYEAEIDPARVAVCHCTDCQVGSASAFRFGVLVHRDRFRLLSGKPKVWIKTAESGRARALSFCPDCGTALHGSDPVEDPEWFSLRLGTARQRRELPPQVAIWCRSALPWVDALGSVPQVDTQGRVPGR